MDKLEHIRWMLSKDFFRNLEDNLQLHDDWLSGNQVEHKINPETSGYPRKKPKLTLRLFSNSGKHTPESAPVKAPSEDDIAEMFAHYRKHLWEIPAEIVAEEFNKLTGLVPEALRADWQLIRTVNLSRPVLDSISSGNPYWERFIERLKLVVLDNQGTEALRDALIRDLEMVYNRGKDCRRPDELYACRMEIGTSETFDCLSHRLWNEVPELIAVRWDLFSKIFVNQPHPTGFSYRS